MFLQIGPQELANMRSRRRRGATGWAAGPPFEQFSRGVVRYWRSKVEAWIHDLAAAHRRSSAG